MNLSVMAGGAAVLGMLIILLALALSAKRPPAFYSPIPSIIFLAGLAISAAALVLSAINGIAVVFA